jgi:hypothetical protein
LIVLADLVQKGGALSIWKLDRLVEKRLYARPVVSGHDVT